MDEKYLKGLSADEIIKLGINLLEDRLVDPEKVIISLKNQDRKNSSSLGENYTAKKN